MALRSWSRLVFDALWEWGGNWVLFAGRSETVAETRAEWDLEGRPHVPLVPRFLAECGTLGRIGDVDSVQRLFIAARNLRGVRGSCDARCQSWGWGVWALGLRSCCERCLWGRLARDCCSCCHLVALGSGYVMWVSTRLQGGREFWGMDRFIWGS